METTIKPERPYLRYIAKPPVSLEKIKYEPIQKEGFYKTPKYNAYFPQGRDLPEGKLQIF